MQEGKPLGQTFNFIARVPAQGAADSLVVLLHGYGDNATVMEKIADEIAAALPYAMIIIPDAPEPFRLPVKKPGDLFEIPQVIFRPQAQALKDRRQWIAMDGGEKELLDRLARTAQTLNAFIDNRRDVLGLGDDRIAIMGFSQGGAQALYTAYLRDHPVACVVAHSAPFLGGTLKSAPPTLYIFGKADDALAQPVYHEFIKKLAAWTDDLTVRKIDHLKHTTCRESRRTAAGYIKGKLG